MSTKTLWISPTDWVSGDPTLRISYPYAAHLATEITATAPGDLKWVFLALRLPACTEITALRVCYQVSNSRSSISQVRLTEMKTPEQALVRHDDPTHLTGVDPTCYVSEVANLRAEGALTLALRLNFGRRTDKIVLGAVGVDLRSYDSLAPGCRAPCVHYADPAAPDQAALDHSSEPATVADIIAGLAADEEATIVFTNCVGPTTEYRFASDYAAPAGADARVTFRIERGARLVAASEEVSVSFNGAIEAGNTQIFAGAGEFVGAPLVDRIVPQWWGARAEGIDEDTFDNGPALQAAINFARASRLPLFIPGSVKEYRVNRSLVLAGSEPIEIYGAGRSQSVLSFYDRTGSHFKAMDYTDGPVHLQDLTIKGHDKNMPGYGIYSLVINTRSSHSIIRNVGLEGSFSRIGMLYGWDGLTARGGADHALIEGLMMLLKIKCDSTLEAGVKIQGTQGGELRNSYLVVQRDNTPDEKDCTPDKTDCNPDETGCNLDAYALVLSNTNLFRFENSYVGGSTRNKLLITTIYGPSRGNKPTYHMQLSNLNFEHNDCAGNKLAGYICIDMRPSAAAPAAALHNVLFENLLFGSSVSSTYAPFRVTKGSLFDSRFRSIQSTVDVHNPDPNYDGIIELQSAYHCSFENLYKKPPPTSAGPNKVTIRAVVDFYGNRVVTSPTTASDNDNYFNVSGRFSGNSVIYMPAAAG